MKCQAKHCNSGLPAAWEPVVLVWPDMKDGRIFQPISIALHDTLVCERCKTTICPAHVVSPERWREVLNVMKSQRLQPPSFRSAKIAFMVPESFDNQGVAP